MNKLVSILIPAFNSEEWIGDCIKAAQAQTYPHKEIIVIDDGSMDATLQIARSYNSPNTLIKTQDNRGASAARNYAFSLAQGDYIQYLDADDLLDPDKIAAQLEYAERDHDARVVFSGEWGQFYHYPEKTQFIPDSLWENLSAGEWLYRKVNENLWMPPVVFLLSREIAEMAGPWNEDLSRDDDGEYMCRIIARACEIRFITGARCRKRRTFGLSSDFTLNDKKLESQAYSIHAHIQLLRSIEDSPRTREACLKLLNRWSKYFYPERPDLIGELEEQAVRLGGHLGPPQLRPKYRLLQRFFGWRLARKAEIAFPAYRLMVRARLEQFM